MRPFKKQLKHVSYESKSFDTLRAERFLDQTTIFHHSYFLQIRTELTFRRFHRKAAALTEGCGFSTVLTLSHCGRILSTI